MEDAFVFHQNEEDLATRLKMVKAGSKPKQFSEALRDNEGKLSLLPKDLDSLRMRTICSTDSVKGRMTYLGGFLERGPQYDSEKRCSTLHKLGDSILSIQLSLAHLYVLPLLKQSRLGNASLFLGMLRRIHARRSVHARSGLGYVPQGII